MPDRKTWFEQQRAAAALNARNSPSGSSAGDYYQFELEAEVRRLDREVNDLLRALHVATAHSAKSNSDAQLPSRK